MCFRMCLGFCLARIADGVAACFIARVWILLYVIRERVLPCVCVLVLLSVRLQLCTFIFCFYFFLRVIVCAFMHLCVWCTFVWLFFHVFVCVRAFFVFVYVCTCARLCMRVYDGACVYRAYTETYTTRACFSMYDACECVRGCMSRA